MSATYKIHQPRETSAKIAYALLITILCCLAAASPAAARDKKDKPAYGRIEVATNPGGYQILVDGVPSGETTTTARLLDLPPGRHTVEIQMPNGARWVRDFNIVAGRKNCIVLNYNPKTISVTKPAKSPCPYPVSVSAPVSVNDGDMVTFASDASYGGNSALNYTWTVSPPSARISSGAGTPTITVDTTGLGRQRVTAILVVDDGSGERACRQVAQASTNIVPLAPAPVQPRKFDEFPSIAFDDDKARLDNLAIELQNTPNAQGYVIVYGGRSSRPGQSDRLGERARSYLVSQRGIDARRIVVVNGGYRDTDYFELYLVPQGAPTPVPAPTVQPSEVQPSMERPSRRTSRRRR
ncbi:MAG: PEGA domain-containing protein [Pyrinomonadaceae bacterium]